MSRSTLTLAVTLGAAGTVEAGVTACVCTATAAASLGARVGTVACVCTATASASLFNPGLVSGTAAWIDGDDLTALSNGANVTSWGHIASFTNTGNFPTFETTGFGGKPSVRFNTVTFLVASGLAVGSGNDVGWWMVVSFQQVSATGMLFSSGATSSVNSAIQRVGVKGSGKWGLVHVGDAGGAVSIDSSSTADTSRHVLSFVVTAAPGPGANFWLDGVSDPLNPQASNGAGQTTLNEGTLGMANTNGVQSQGLNGRLRRGAFGIGTLSTLDRQRLEGWANG